MRYFEWIKGRQAGGYEKMLLLESFTFKFDLYLLRFPKGCEVKRHRDPTAPGCEHHRLNVTLKKPTIGGHVYVEGPKQTWLRGRIMKFRPDLYYHWMSEVRSVWGAESMYMLSLGWLRREK